MKNFTVSLGIGLTQLIMEYWVILAQSEEKPKTHYYEPKRKRRG